MSGHQTTRSGVLLLPFLALVLIHALTGLQMEQPLVLADELGYLGNARYLSGAGHLPDMEGSQFYHFGYSLFLVPLFWVFSEPSSIYRAALVVNALLSGALFFPLRRLLIAFAEVPAATAAWIAFACCLYPSLVLYSSFAWTECAFILFYAVVVVLFGRYLESRSNRDALLLGLIVGLLYTIHPRALPILVAVLLYLAVLAVLRAIAWRQLLLGSTVLAAVVLVTRLVNQHLKSIGWQGAGEVSVGKMAGRLLPGSDFGQLVERALGQLLYLSLASHGLVLVGLVAMLWLIGRGVRSGSLRRLLASPRTGIPIFVLSTASGVFAAASTLKLYSLHGERSVRGADFIHGRYNEALAVVLIAWVLGELASRRLSRRQLVWIVGIAVVMTIGLSWVVMLEVEDALRRQAGAAGEAPRAEVLPSEVDAVAVPGVYPYIGLLGALELRRIAWLAVGGLLATVFLTRLSPRSGATLLALVFAVFSYYNYREFLLPRMARVKPRLAMAAEVRRLGPVSEISYDVSYREPGLVSALQFLLPEAVFRRFHGRSGQEPVADVVIASSTWAQADRLDARFLLASGRGGALWLLPGRAALRPGGFAWEGATLGAKGLLELRESGFYRQESFEGVPGRWTNGAATLMVPLEAAGRLPGSLAIETLAPGRDGTRLQLLVNGVELWNQEIPRGAWANTFALEGVPLGDELLIELNSDTFTPAERSPSSGDRRRLGVVVTGIRLSGAEAAVP